MDKHRLYPCKERYKGYIDTHAWSDHNNIIRLGLRVSNTLGEFNRVLNYGGVMSYRINKGYTRECQRMYI